MKLDSPITEIKGIGAKTEKLMNRIGVYTLWDILLHYPRDYIKFQEPVTVPEIGAPGICAVSGKLSDALRLTRAGRMEIVTGKLGRGNKCLELTWFHMPYMKSRLKPGEPYIFYGKIKEKGNHFAMEQPEVYTPEQYQGKMQALQPVYSRTEGLSNSFLIKTV
ncbi:MAG: DNA helicase RecG, partial [Lachnospiraceae bacterium]|nr:DNA helicase RecG [Lachnospiraceae bacterium]